MSLTADQTSNLDDGRYVYDLEILQTSSSTVTRVIEGIINVHKLLSNSTLFCYKYTQGEK